MKRQTLAFLLGENISQTSQGQGSKISESFKAIEERGGGGWKCKLGVYICPENPIFS